MGQIAVVDRPQRDCLDHLIQGKAVQGFEFEHDIEHLVRRRAAGEALGRQANHLDGMPSADITSTLAKLLAYLCRVGEAQIDTR